MFDRLKYIIKAIKNYSYLEKELLEFKAEFSTFKLDPVNLVRTITDDKFIFFDYTELPKNDLKSYHDQAVNILKSQVFQNEVARLNASFIQWAAKQSKDFDGVRDMRHQISGINLLEERLASIPDPFKQENITDKIYDSI